MKGFPPSLALSVPSPSSPILIPSFLLVKEKGEEEGQSAKRGGGGWGEKLVPEDTRKGRGKEGGRRGICFFSVERKEASSLRTYTSVVAQEGEEKNFRTS